MLSEQEVQEDSGCFEIPPVNAGVALCWILLFAVRWIGFPVLQALGVLNGAKVNALDHGPLLIVYLVLLIAIIAIAGMQAVHSREGSTPKGDGSGR